MQLTCSRRALLQALRLLQHAVDLHSTLPDLTAVQLTAESGTVRLAATNLHLGISCQVTGSIAQTGKVHVPLHPLLSYLKTCTDEVLVLQTREVLLAGETPCTALVVNSQLALVSLDGSWFPTVQCPSHALLRVRLAAARFKALCSRAACAASRVAAEPLLSCVWLSIQALTLTLATCDLQRCAIETMTCAGEGTLKELFFLPARPLLTLVRLLPAHGEVELLIDTRKSLLCLRAGAVDFLLRLVDGQEAGSERTRSLMAPLQQEKVTSPFEQLVPQRYRTLIHVSKQVLQAVVKKQSWPMSCSLETSQDGTGTLILRVYQPSATITHHLPVQVWGAPIASCWLHMRDLAEAICCPGTPSHLMLAYGDPSGAILLRWLGPEGVDATYAYVFKSLDRFTLSRVPQMREQLPEAVRQWVAQQIDLAQQRQEALALIQVRTDVLYRIVCSVHYGLAPTKEEVQHSVGQLKHLAKQPDYAKRDACINGFDELTRMLALAAFAPGGSCLELSPEKPAIRLSFDARMILTALQEGREARKR